MKTTEVTKNSKTSISQGSKSFSLASRFFSKQLQEDVAHLYSWCRWCDDVADGSTLGFNQNPFGLPEDRVDLLFRKSQLAFLGKSEGLELPFIAFGQVMKKYDIPWLYAEDLLKGMQQDVSAKTIYSFEDLLLYCYRVAGTVGLIMCHIMGIKNPKSLEKAVHLGIALQLTNIVRDIGDDYRVSKIYLPKAWLSEFNIPPQELLNPEHSSQLESLANQLLKKADQYYRTGLTGLTDLPWRCALAVAVAASVYRKIGRKVLRHGHLSWRESKESTPFMRRVSLAHWDRIQACLLGICLFLKTVPSRILFPRPTIKIDQIWRYS